MRKNRIGILLLSVALLFTTAPVAQAEDTDNELSEVRFHTQYTDDQGARALREGVVSLWTVVSPRVKKKGIEDFPRAEVLGFNNEEDAARVSGISRSRWKNFGGYAYKGRAYIIFRDKLSFEEGVYLTAHEAMHLLQYEISAGKVGSYCISEGAAEWYKVQVIEHRGGQAADKRIEEYKSLNSEDKIVGVSEEVKAQLEEHGYEPNPLPAFSELATQSQFQDAHKERGAVIYALCLLAFDLLLETGGGEDAYFEYLFELRRSDWRTAFNQAFSEDLETFRERFKAYRESRFEDYRLPREIEHDEYINKLLDCRRLGLWTRKICIQ